MKRYGQFCSIAQSLEVVGERWTLLVLREILMGSERFGDIRRGVPLMSPSLLSTRLRTLAETGVIERVDEGGRPAYRPTSAGRELLPVIESLGVWGRRWVRAIDDVNLDISLLMWDMRRSLKLAELPRERTQLFFHFHDGPPNKRSWWFRIAEGAAELCLSDPGMDNELEVRTSVRTMTEVWMGVRSLDAALRDKDIQVEGAHDIQSVLPQWIGLSPFAPVKMPG